MRIKYRAWHKAEKKMINEIQRRLEAGEVVELECIDEHGFTNIEVNRIANELIIKQDLLAVESVCYDEERVYLKGDIDPFIFNAINFDELKYFKIKDQTPTFNDLIDVAVQAYKDGVITSQLTIMSTGIHFFGEERSAISFSNLSKGIEKGIEFIKSLYTETFIIEHQSDFSKINHNDNKTKIVLSNGELVNDDIWDMLKNQSGNAQFLMLKGATVTQKRGSHD